MDFIIRCIDNLEKAVLHVEIYENIPNKNISGFHLRKATSLKNIKNILLDQNKNLYGYIQYRAVNTLH
jgi:hypothetical protein